MNLLLKDYGENDMYSVRVNQDLIKATDLFKNTLRRRILIEGFSKKGGTSGSVKHRVSTHGGIRSSSGCCSGQIKGGGRVKSKSAITLKSLALTSKSIIRIETDDKSCGYRSIAVGLIWLSAKDANNKRLAMA